MYQQFRHQSPGRPKGRPYGTGGDDRRLRAVGAGLDPARAIIARILLLSR
jgi:hypothetical protein